MEAQPSKIIAVHVAYRSRAMERGRLPPWPSYFLKPPSTLAADGDPVLRPPRCELLAFEGEVALVIGTRATRVSPADAWRHVRWVTAANDFGVYDLRYADNGSNVRSKGIDGFTPLGPGLLDARAVDPERIRLRTWVNGKLAQDGLSGDDLLFSFSDIVADISRLTTLESGDVILTGTPAGSTVVRPGDLVEVEVTAASAARPAAKGADDDGEAWVSTGRLRSPVGEADYELSPPGAMPNPDDAQRGAAYGAGGAPGPSGAPAELLSAVGRVSTATLSSQLRRRGFNSVTLDGLRATKPGGKMVGFARTLRYVPFREDLFAAYGGTLPGGGLNAQKRAIEQLRPGEVLVIEARGDPTAGTVGDILALRAQVRGAAGIVTDGAIRDSQPLHAMDLPVYYGATHPAVLGRRHVPWEANAAIACAGVTVLPGDIVVGDGDGVIVVPAHLAVEVARDAAEQELREEFAAEMVAGGEPVDGLYPLGERWQAAYEAWLAERGKALPAGDPRPSRPPSGSAGDPLSGPAGNPRRLRGAHTLNPGTVTSQERGGDMAAESTVSFPGLPGTGSGRRTRPAKEELPPRAGSARRERLADRRKALGLTQEDLAVLLKVDRSTVVRWEHGDTQPLPLMRRRLAAVLLVSPDRLAEILHASSQAGGRSGRDAARADGGPAAGDSLSRAVPRQLPPAVPDFTGRTAELAELTGMLAAVGTIQGSVVLSAISGTAGVGKTALALRWAHQYAGCFPDGQLHVNLRGFGPAGTPATAEEAIRGFLDALGVPPERVPAGLDAQSALYRSLLSGKRMLILLDNARDEEQVRPLLPSSHSSMVIVTSRNQLAGLAAADGARLLTLEVLGQADAVRLLTARLGAPRAAAEPDAVTEIAARCACLPLAVAVAGARAAARPGLPLAGLAAELRDAVGSGSLDAFDSDDPAASVTAVFSWSYKQLSEAAARLFRLAGLHPGPDVTIPAAASLAAVGEAEARRLLRELTRAHLLTEHAPGRYTCHDLLRAYAASLARACHSQADRDAAVTRLLDHYLHTASAASLVIRPRRDAIALAPPAPGAIPEPCGDHQQAMAWFDREHQVLLAAAALAGGTGFDRHAWQLSWAVMPFLTMRGHLHEALATQGAALAAATRLGTPAGQAVCGQLLAEACHLSGDDEGALRHFTHSRALYQRLGDRRGEATVARWLAAVAERQGRVDVALSRYQEALRLRPPADDKAEEAEVLNNVGRCHALLGDYQRARDCCQRSLALAAELDPRSLKYHVRDSLGYIAAHLGGFKEAVTHFEQALRLCRGHGDRMSEARILTHLGDACADAGEFQAARDAWRLACGILDDLGHPRAVEVRAKLAGTA